MKLERLPETLQMKDRTKEEKKVLIEENLNNNNTSLAFYIEGENGNYEESSSLPSRVCT